MNMEINKQDPVNEVLPIKESSALAFQHLLASYASLVVTPIVVGGALGWSQDILIFMLGACLISSGICTIIQCVGLPYGIGIKLPIVQGTTVAAIPALIMIGSSDGLTAIFGATIISGIFVMLIAPWWAKILKLFPPVVTGTVILVIGITLFPIAVMWMGGGNGLGAQSVEYSDIILGVSTLIITLLAMKLGKGFISRISILIGLISGTFLAVLMNDVDFSTIGNAEWFGFIFPLSMGMPVFKLSAILAMLITMIVTMIESTGDYIAAGAVCNKKVDEKEIVKGLKAEGLGTIIGGLFNSFPYTTYSQNIGVLRVSGVKSRWVVALSGIFLILLGLFPKLSAVIACIPLPVLGGVSIVLFGSIMCTGIKILKQVDFDSNSNLVITSVSVGLAMIAVSNPLFFSQLPSSVNMVLGNSISLGGISALTLHLIFNYSDIVQKKDCVTNKVVD